MKHDFNRDILIADTHSNSLVEVLRVNASDADNGDNAVISYSLLNPPKGFSIAEKSGVIYVNESNFPLNLIDDIQLAVVATDHGQPPLRSVSSVRIKVNSGNGVAPNLAKKEYKYVSLRNFSLLETNLILLQSPTV